ncbi:MAG: type II toxin-antitoxin system RelE/ParE family toxin [Rudanella sp.]|nr:type II toxin-antitoxin system RelE/ParE family toxin [Rudanella sp.]
MANTYRIEYDETALNDLIKLPKKSQQQIIKAISRLADSPRSGSIKQLKEYDKLFRLHTGDYRIIYSIEDNIILITIVAVSPRKDIYDLLKRRID